MAARRLNSLPPGKSSQQIAHQRRLAYVGSIAADSYDKWLFHLPIFCVSLGEQEWVG